MRAPRGHAPAGRVTAFVALGLLLLAGGALGEELLSIEGRVLDDTGAPVVGYPIIANPPRDVRLRDPTFRPQAVTDAAGRFALRELPPGTYWLGSGESPTHARLPMARVPAGTTDLELRVAWYRTIEGVARDPQGRPLAGARVSVRRMATPRGPDAPTRTPGNEPLATWTFTDAKGRFRIERYPSGGPIEVRVQPPPGRERELIRGLLEDVVAGAAPLEVKVSAAYVIAGVVRDEEGRPVPGVRVKSSGSMNFVRDRELERLTRETFTDEAGRYELRPFLPEERVWLQFEGPQGVDPAWFDGSLQRVAAGRTDADLVLRRGQVVSGRIVGVDPEALRGLSIIACVRKSQVAGHSFDGRSNRFRIQPLPRSKVELHFRLKRRHRLVLPRRIELVPPAADLLLRVAHGHELRGRVTSRLESHRIGVNFVDAWGREHLHERVDEDGTFEIPGLPPGPGFLYVTASARGRFLVVDEAWPGRGPLDLRLVSARKVRGRILGLPWPVRRGHVTARRGPLAYEARIEPDGSFETGPLAPGPWDFEYEIVEPKGVVAPRARVEAGTHDLVEEWGAGD